MTEERAHYDSGRTPDSIPLEIEGIEICQWHPTPDPKDSEPEQVHLIINIGDKGLPIQRFVFRFKGPNTLDQLVDQMITHRVEVWGPRGARTS